MSASFNELRSFVTGAFSRSFDVFAFRGLVRASHRCLIFQGQRPNHNASRRSEAVVTEIIA